MCPGFRVHYNICDDDDDDDDDDRQLPGDLDIGNDCDLFQYDLVLEDCNQALIIDFHCTKALYRRALGFKVGIL